MEPEKAINEEKTVFRGNPSPVTCLGSFIFSIFLLALIAAQIVIFWNRLSTNDWLRYGALAALLIPVGIFLTKWIFLKTVVYEITSERIRVRKGLLSKRTDELELYRVKDTSL